MSEVQTLVTQEVDELQKKVYKLTAEISMLKKSNKKNLQIIQAKDQLIDAKEQLLAGKDYTIKDKEAQLQDKEKLIE